MRYLRSLAVVFISVGFISVPASALALPGQDAPAPTVQISDSIADLEAKTSALASQLRCPVCQGLSIEDSPTELALEMRGVIRDQLAAGRTPKEVEEYFVSKYGEWILLQPKPEGFNLAVYALPIAALVLGGGVVGVAVRRWTRKVG